MAASALLKFVQGINTGANGEAFFGELTTPAEARNSVNTDVASWQFDLLYVPPGSSLVVGDDFAHGDSASPLANFVPDVRGGYRWRLKVWGAPGRNGAPADIDIRVFGVKEVNGLLVPPSQVWPLPLADARSGSIGSKPNEMNFGGELDGWAGSGSDGLFNEVIKRVDADVPVLLPAPSDKDYYLAAAGLADPVAIFFVRGEPWAVCQGNKFSDGHSSLVHLNPVAGTVLRALIAPELNEVWRNAIEITGNPDGYNVAILCDNLTSKLRFFRLAKIDASISVPSTLSEDYAAFEPPLLDYFYTPVANQGYVNSGQSYFVARKGPPSSIAFWAGLVYVAGTGAALTLDVANYSLGTAGVRSPVGIIGSVGMPNNGAIFLNEWLDTGNWTWEISGAINWGPYSVGLGNPDQQSLNGIFVGPAGIYVFGVGNTVDSTFPMLLVDWVTGLISATAPNILVSGGTSDCQVLSAVYDEITGTVLALVQEEGVGDNRQLFLAILNATTLALLSSILLFSSYEILFHDVHMAIDQVNQNVTVPLEDKYHPGSDPLSPPASTVAMADLLLHAYALILNQKAIAYLPHDAVRKSSYVFYVDGSDYSRFPYLESGDGSEDYPFSNLQEALDRVRDLYLRGLLGVAIIYVAPGFAYSGGTLTLDGDVVIAPYAALPTVKVVGEHATNTMVSIALDYSDLSLRGFSIEFHRIIGALVVAEGPGVSGTVYVTGVEASLSISASALSLLSLEVAADNTAPFYGADSGGTIIRTATVWMDGSATSELKAKGAYVPATSQVVAGAIELEDSIVHGPLVSYTTLTLKNTTYDGAVSVTATALYLDSESFKSFVGDGVTTTPVGIYGGSPFYPINAPLEYVTPEPISTTTAGAHEILRILTNGFPRSTGLCIEFEVEAFCPGGTNDCEFEHFGYFKIDGAGVLTLRGESEEVSTGLFTSNSVALSVGVDGNSRPYIALTATVVGTGADLVLAWKVLARFSFTHA